MLKQVWWDMIIWSFIKCTCSFLYLFFLPPLSISYTQKWSFKVRNMEQKNRKKKRPFNLPNLKLWIVKLGLKNLREYKIHDAIKESLLFYLHWETFPGQGGVMGELGRINHFLLTDPIETVLLFPGGGKRYHKSLDKFKYLRAEESYVITFPKAFQGEPGRV